MTRGVLLATLTTILAAGANHSAAADPTPAPPPTKTDNVKETLHGVEITDPYRWLEDQDSKDTRAWIDAQNKYTHSVLANWPWREKVAKRLGELMKVDSVGMPVAAGGRYFFSRRKADEQLAVICMRAGLQAADEVLIDPHPLSPDRTVNVRILGVSHDGKLMAYAVQQGGEDEVLVKFFDVDARKDIGDRLPKGRYSGISITPDRKGVYYARHDKDGPRVRYHPLPPSAFGDIEIFGNGLGAEKYVGCGLSEDGRKLLITVSHGAGGHKSEIWISDVSDHLALIERKTVVTPIVNDLDAHFAADIAGDTVFLTTNWKAPRGRVLAVDLNKPKRDDWKEIIAEDKTAVLRGLSAVGGKLVGSYLDNVTSKLRVFDTAGKPLRDIKLPALGSSGGVSGRWEGSEGFYSFTSFVYPSTIFRYDTATGESTIWAKSAVPIRGDEFEVTQVAFESKDKTRIPMFLIHRKDLKRDGRNPTLLYGYGGFNISLTPAFSSLAAVWVENGGVYAVANLRGGGEFGEDWHKAGMLDRKQNTFDDFLAAADHLIAGKITAPDKLAIAGGSNGGLLVGAALVQRPELFAAVVCSVPLLDMVRYHKFLVAKFWVPEYGSSENKDQFKYLHAYSPYHHVKKGERYPAVMFITGDSDTRVAPLHARKMAALLQAESGSGNPVLLHYDTKGGHSGGKPVAKVIEDLTDEFAFLFSRLDVPAGSKSAPIPAQPPAATATADAPPPTKAIPVKDVLHGVTITDDYRWLEDQNSPETRAWLAAQSKYAAAVLATAPDREAIRKRLTALKKTDSYGLPVKAGGRWFFSRRLKDAELSVLCMRTALDGADTVLVDPVKLFPDKSVSVSLSEISEDGEILIYALQKGGEDEQTLRVIHVGTGQVLDARMPKARYSNICLQRDNSAFFYSVMTDAGSRIRRHVLGADPADDVEVFGKGTSAEQFVDVAMSEDGKRLIYSVSTGWDKTELFVQDVERAAPPINLTAGLSGKFDARIIGDTCYLFTDWEAANGRIMLVDLRKPAKTEWKEIIPARDASIEGFSAVGGKLFVNYLKDVNSEIRVFDAAGKPLGQVQLPGIGSASAPSGRWAEGEAFFTFTSFLTPGTVCRLDTAAAAAKVWFRPAVPVDADKFVVKQLKYKSKDGTTVPMFVVHAKTTKLDGSNPTLLYGYGGFNSSETPAFSSLAAVWVENGGVYAVANIRGGAEFGEEWHKAGMLSRKQNVFDDFIAAGEHLIAEKYTRADRLAIMGGSNGGLLVGAALTQKPELFAAVICEVPLLDMLRYHKFLLGPLWVPEYGSADNAGQFKYLHAYSPYHHVTKGVKYPAVMLMTGDSDTRVAPLHARKMTALLQAATASGPERPIILHYDTSAGHSGEKPVAKQIEDTADVLGFLFKQLGVNPAK